MSARPSSTVVDARQDGAPQIAGSAVVLGVATLGFHSGLSEGAVIRSTDDAVVIGTGSHVIENCVVAGYADHPVEIGRRTVFGHRCMVIGATVGDLCEIGNASVLMPGVRLGDRVLLGEGTVVPSGTTLPSDVVAVGRPARIVRSASNSDLDRLTALRGGDLSVPAPSGVVVQSNQGGAPMGQLYAYRGILPVVAPTAVLFPTAEITGDVVIGERSIIGAGVKIIGDSHGPVRIGNDVQILENTVLHLLPDNNLVIDDGATVGPGAIVCDGSVVGADSIVRAGAVVKQRSQFASGTEIDGMPATEVGRLSEPPDLPSWALHQGDLPEMTPQALGR